MAIPRISPYQPPSVADLPDNKVAWKPDPRRAVLLIHDMQDYFLDFFDVAASPIPQLLDNVCRIRRHCSDMGIPVVYTAQPAEQTPAQRGLLQDMWGDGLKARPHRKDVVALLAPEPGDTVLTKWRYSAFQRTELLDMLRSQGRDQLIICGIYAHIGCMLTASDAFMFDIQPFFVADAVADFSLENHLMAVTYIAQRCGVVLSTQSLLDDLAVPSALDPAAVAAGTGAIPGSLEDLRREIAELLQVAPDEIADDDNLLFVGLDSIRLMSIVERWRRLGAQVTFVELAERSTAAGWWAILDSRRVVTTSAVGALAHA